jgi:hypothetical protein
VLRLILQQPSLPPSFGGCWPCVQMRGGCWSREIVAPTNLSGAQKAMPRLVDWSIICPIAIGTAAILVFTLHLIG